MSILEQKISARRILGMIAGVVIIGIGIAVFKFSHLGNDSISALNLRLAELVGLPFSIENVLMNLFLFVPQLIWGGGTSDWAPSSTVFASASLSPSRTMRWRRYSVLPTPCPPSCSGWLSACWSWPSGVPCTRQRILGVAPYDALSLMMSDRLPLPYFGCRVFTDALCALLAYLLGGLIGLGTLICAFGLGPFVQFFTKHFSEKVLRYSPAKK